MTGIQDIDPCGGVPRLGFTRYSPPHQLDLKASRVMFLVEHREYNQPRVASNV